MSVKSILVRTGETLSKNSPTILTGLGVAGVLSTAILAVKATPKALKVLELEQDRREKYGESITIPAVDTVKLCWKLYLPAAAVGIASMGCIIGAHKVNLRRNAAMAGLYSLTETAFKEYQAKVTETLGSNKEHKIHDEIARDRVRANPVGVNEIIITGQGEMTCYDALTGRYFKADVEKIRQIVNEFNRNLMNDGFISLNEFYYELGLSGVKLGDMLGWDIDKGLIEAEFSSCLTEENKPCLVMDFNIYPKYNR